MKYYKFTWLKDKIALKWCKHQCSSFYPYLCIIILCLAWFGLLKTPLIIQCVMVTLSSLWNVFQPVWVHILHQTFVIHQLTQPAGLILVKLWRPQWLGKNNDHHYVISHFIALVWNHLLVTTMWWALRRVQCLVDFHSRHHQIPVLMLRLI